MQSAFNEIRATYDLETLRDIVDHGCKSGTASEHIYYADTIGFFDDHAEEITEYIKDVLGHEVLSDTLKHNQGDLDLWKNDLTWTFIELVASFVCDEVDQQQLDDDKVIESYQSDYTLADSIVDDVLQSGYNPPGCMTDQRYAHMG